MTEGTRPSMGDGSSSGSTSINGGTGGTGGSTRSVGEIVGDLSRDMTTLVRQEIDLATSELKNEITKLGKGAGMFGGAGATGYLSLIFLSLALTYLLDNWMPVELAALIVGLLWLVVTAALAARGRQEIKNANPDLPVTQQTLKEDAQWARTQKS
jgi:uncharacterized membrane protein YqjE